MHRAFRYPAKFHGPYARALLETVSDAGDRVLDPFCGSGTLILEGQLINRTVDGCDVDPLACFVATAKSQTYDLQALRFQWKALSEALDPFRRAKERYAELRFDDISELELAELAAEVWVPDIPRINHWFRRYVIEDLARIFAAIEHVDRSERDFFRLAAASIIRLSSNADPVPVSGLEVTSHMLKRDEQGRLVNPFALLSRAVSRNLAAIDEYEQLPTFARSERQVWQADSTSDLEGRGEYDSLVTSPPYHGAVDYYRRHTLEMYWLGLTQTQEERLEILPRYIGRVRVGHRDLDSDLELRSSYARELALRMQTVSDARARGFIHYVVGMQKHFAQAAKVVRPGGRAVYMVGNSRWQGEVIDTPRLLKESIGNSFVLQRELTHEVKNRYMSYSRRNNASIDQEHSIVFERTS